ncbi:MAG: methyl-accepting chemotaxis protein [Cytophagales bacterium]|nr:methyl-accepting chemotaxis protein [Cytophagales bacterium]
MLKGLSIRLKMLVPILGVALITYTASVIYVGRVMSQNSVENAQKLTDLGSREKARLIQADFEGYLSLSGAMSKLIEDYVELSGVERLANERQLLQKVQESDPELRLVWISWEMSVLDPNWQNDFGRERHAYVMDATGAIAEFQDTTDVESFDPENFYYVIRESRTEGAAEPYLYNPVAFPDDLGTSIVSPIQKGDQYLGQVGFDFSIDRYQSTTSFETFERGYAIVISDLGRIVAHPDESYINKYVDQLSLFEDEDILQVRSSLSKGEAVPLEKFDAHLGAEAYANFVNVPIGNSNSFWTVGTVVPAAEIKKDARVIIRNASILGVVGLLALTLVIGLITRHIVNSLRRSESLLNDLAKGNIDNSSRLVIAGNDELGRTSRSVNALQEALSRKAAFAEEIGNGNMESAFEISGKNDQLGRSLVQMRDNLLDVLNELKTVVSAAAEEGDLNLRIEATNKLGAWHELTHSMNNLLTSFHQPFQSIETIAHLMAEGDLTERLDEDMHGDIGAMMRNLNQGLQNLTLLLSEATAAVQDIRGSAEIMLRDGLEMDSSTSEIAQSIHEMSNGAKSQLDQIDRSSQLIEQIMRSSEEMEGQVQDINEAAKSSAEKSQQGLSLITNVNENMGDISNFSMKTNASFRAFVERSNEISRVLSVITDIAAQTNLLALNAAIEAAQAGDAGRGFAVVAEEIRKLAEDSRQSVKSIASLVEDVQSDSKEATEVLFMMNERIQAGAKASQEASEAFKGITEATDGTLALTEGINVTSTQQKAAIQDVVGITESVVIIAEQTAAGTEEVATSATQLANGMAGFKKRSEELEQITQRLIAAFEKFRLKD